MEKKILLKKLAKLDEKKNELKDSIETYLKDACSKSEDKKVVFNIADKVKEVIKANTHDLSDEEMETFVYDYFCDNGYGCYWMDKNGVCYYCTIKAFEASMKNDELSIFVYIEEFYSGEEHRVYESELDSYDLCYAFVHFINDEKKKAKNWVKEYTNILKYGS